MPPGAPTISPASVLAALPATLRGEVVQSLNEVLRNYRERRWEPSELNGGKLCEVAYTILRGYVDGSFPSKASKPANMVDACKALELSDLAKFPRSVRIQIPRMLIALYEIRNNRGVGHVGGDVNPNLMDATAVVAMTKWTVAELVRIFHSVSTAEAEAVVEALAERTIPIVWPVGGTQRVLKPSMTAKEKVLVLLYRSPNWVDEDTIREWTEYSNASNFRKILVQCHRAKLLEYDKTAKRLMVSPLGIRYVEEKISLDG